MGKSGYWEFISSFTNVNVPVKLEPRVLTVTMIATEIPAAIRPYSIAVAPDSSLANFDRRFMFAVPDLKLILNAKRRSLIVILAELNKKIGKN